MQIIRRNARQAVYAECFIAGCTFEVTILTTLSWDLGKHREGGISTWLNTRTYIKKIILDAW